MQKRKFRELSSETMILIADTADKNPGLTAEQVGKLCDVSRASVGNVLRARRVAMEQDASYLSAQKEPTKQTVARLVGKWCEILGLPPVVEVAAPKEPKTEPKAPAAPEGAENDALFYAKLLQSVQCLPEILSALKNLSDKLTVLNQRLYDPVNELSYKLDDLADTQHKVVQKLDRVAKSVSVFPEGELAKTPVTVYDAIENGFNDVCGKLDTVRYKLEKAVK